MASPKQCPDVTNTETARIERCLDKVGMSNIEIPIRLEIPEFGQQMCPGLADAYVSLDKPEAKGIHMSRLFLSLQKKIEKDVISFDLLKDCLDEFVATHEGLSKSSHISVRFDMPVKRASLLSKQMGWRSYPIKYSASRVEDKYTYELSVMMQYSSTCPCSAALSRQLIQKNFSEQFAGQQSVSVHDMTEWLGKESSIMATPHGQRSHAHVSIVPETTGSGPAILQIIDACESALSTPVQAAVKREDEQEFARLNGTNLMFAEDACRKLALAVEGLSGVLDYRVEARHLESLHAHDAVAITTKGECLQPKQSW